MTASCVFTDLTVRRGHGRGARLVLSGVSGEIPSGAVVAIVGPNGAGKSTLLESLVGLHPISQGSVQWMASERAAPFQRAISLQTSGLPRQRTVDEFLHVIAALYGSSRTPEQARATLGLTIAGKTRVKALSGGQAHRLRVAAAWISAAPVLLLDEPTSGVDAGSAEAIRRLVRAHANSGGSVILVTHLLDDVRETADHVYAVHDGELSTVPSRATMPELAFTLGLPDLSNDDRDDLVPVNHLLERRGEDWVISGPDAHDPELVARITAWALARGTTVTRWHTSTPDAWWHSMLGGTQ